MEINISTKFEIGQEVYTIKKVQNTKGIKETCPICEGGGSFIHNGHKIFCANCGGHGYYEISRKKIIQHMIGDYGKISSMRLQIPGSNTKETARETDSIKYLRYRVNGNFYPEFLVFATEEEAVAACKELDKDYIGCNECTAENV